MLQPNPPCRQYPLCRQSPPCRRMGPNRRRHPSCCNPAKNTPEQGSRAPTNTPTKQLSFDALFDLPCSKAERSTKPLGLESRGPPKGQAVSFVTASIVLASIPYAVHTDALGRQIQENNHYEARESEALPNPVSPEDGPPPRCHAEIGLTVAKSAALACAWPCHWPDRPAKTTASLRFSRATGSGGPGTLRDRHVCQMRIRFDRFKSDGGPCFRSEKLWPPTQSCTARTRSHSER